MVSATATKNACTAAPPVFCSSVRFSEKSDPASTTIQMASTNITTQMAGPAQSWLSQATEAFERERLYLVRLTAAVGPLPSTPGAAETEASLVAARHALETLALSERRGCALGAATALVGDWQPVRRLLGRAAARVGTEAPAPWLPDEQSIVEVIGNSSDGPAGDRALAFGGQQMLLQHRALFDLLEARADARGDF